GGGTAGADRVHGEPDELVLDRLGREFPHHRQFRYRARLHDRDLPDPNPRHRGWGGFRLRHSRWLDLAGDPWLDRDVAFDRGRAAATGDIVLPYRSALYLVRARHDPARAHGFRRREGLSWYGGAAADGESRDRRAKSYD